MGIRPRDPILTTWLLLWELRHKDLSLALPLSGSANPSPALSSTLMLPSWYSILDLPGQKTLADSRLPASPEALLTGSS